VLIFLLIIAFVVSWVCHTSIRAFWLACVMSVVASLPPFILLAQPHFGWFDSTFYENLLMSGFVATAVTLAVGSYVRRRKHTPRKTE
jgi:hypothetical protein